MEIQEQTKGAVRVLRPAGPLVGSDADKLKARALQASLSSLGKVVIDAGAVPFVDSRGLEVLVELSEELSSTGRVLKLVGANETVREVMEITEIAPLLEQYDDLNGAVRSFL